ncbi:FAD-binding protein [Streptomyces boncukensis]|uniref:FAD-binding oxidoreductase n=1 Tax=Streptomyces boncukensis TaxID=2711219 RepID=A0A6G4X807_9ACTN|nr:FAD-binding oxidoreductase [Streptomyces boncukensis]
MIAYSTSSSHLLGDTAWDALRGGLAGELLLPGDSGYAEARRTADERYDDARPRAVLRCAGEEDVREGLHFARVHRIPVHVRAGGHCFAGFSTGPGLVLDISPLSGTVVEGDRARCGAGTLTGPFADALDERRRVVPTGLCPTVGVAGLTLGGGMGTTGRCYGFALDSLVGARVVLASGRVVECDERRHPELFWALRGGGHAGLGVVTELGFRTYPELPVTDFLLGWPLGWRARVLTAWQAWGPRAPDVLSSMAGLTAGEPWECLSPAAVGGAWLGERRDLERHLAELVAAVGREPDTYTTVTHGQRGSLRFWGGTSRRRLPLVLRRHEFFDRPLPLSAARELIASLERGLAPGESRNCDFEALGGAYNRVPAPATAMVHRGHLFGMLSQFRPPPGGDTTGRGPTGAALDALHRRLRALASGNAYQNYAEADRPHWQRAYFGANYPRLAAARERYDPDHVLGYPFGRRT